MVSLLLCSRAKGNTNHGLERFLQSLIDSTFDYTNIEVLIKIDDDDDEFNFDLLKGLPFHVEHIIGPRGRGYADLHKGYAMAFDLRDAKSIMVGAVADDFTVCTTYWDRLLLNAAIGFKGDQYIIHSHPVNLGFSFEDMSNVLVDDAPFWSVELIKAVGQDWLIYGTDAWTSALEKVLRQNEVNISLAVGTTLFRRHSDQSIDGPAGSRWNNERKQMFDYISTKDFAEKISKQASAIIGRLSVQHVA